MLLVLVYKSARRRGGRRYLAAATTATAATPARSKFGCSFICNTVVWEGFLAFGARFWIYLLYQLVDQPNSQNFFSKMGMVCGRNSKRVKRDRYSGYIEDSEKVSSKQSILQLEGMGVKESQENKKSPKNDFSPKKAKIRGIEDTWIEKFNMNRLNNPLLPSGGLEDFQNLLDTQESQEFVYIPKNRDIQDFESYCRSYPSTSFSNHWKIAV